MSFFLSDFTTFDDFNDRFFTSFANILPTIIWLKTKFFIKKIIKNNTVIDVFLFLIRKVKNNSLFIFENNFKYFL